MPNPVQFIVAGMFTDILVVLAVLAALVALALIYWTVLKSMYPATVRTDEVHVVKTRDLWKLKIYRFRRGRTEGPPVLLVHGAGANHRTWASPAGACLVEHLVAKGYDCWAIDLRGCRSCEPPFERTRYQATIDGQMLYDLPAAMHYIRKHTGYDKLHWIGHSLGGMLLYAYTQEFGEEHIASGVTLGSPIGFEGTDLKINELQVALIRTFPALAHRVFHALLPLGMMTRRGSRYFPTNMHNLPDNADTGHFMNMTEGPLPGVFGELKYWAQNKLWLMKDGQLDVRAGLSTMRFPLLAIYGVRDPFIPIDRAQAFVKKLPHDDKRILILGKEHDCEHDYNHCDLVFGKNGTREVFEPIAQWLARHEDRSRIAPSEYGEAPAQQLRPPLGQNERARILSGQSYLHSAAEEDSDPVSAEADVAVPELIDVTVDREAPVVQAEAEDQALPSPPKARPKKKAAASTRKAIATPAAKKKSSRKKSVAGAETIETESPTKKKAIAKKKAVAKSGAKPKTKAVAKTKAAAKKKNSAK